MAGDVDSEIETETAEEVDDVALEDLSEDDLIDEDGIDDGLDEDGIDDVLVADDDDEIGDAISLADVEEVLEGGVVKAVVVESVATPAATDAEEAVVDDDEDLIDDDDVEASLDVILKERLVVPDDEDDEGDETPEVEDRGDGSGRVLPKQPGEFVCQSCFLVKNQTQLADRKRKLCRDCV
jgi:hypothetical protein